MFPIIVEWLLLLHIAFTVILYIISYLLYLISKQFYLYKAYL